jgi:hypothetical protein
MFALKAEPTLVCSTQKVFHSGKLLTYLQTLDKAEKVCKGQTDAKDK